MYAPGWAWTLHPHLLLRECEALDCGVGGGERVSGRAPRRPWLRFSSPAAPESQMFSTWVGLLGLGSPAS